MSKITYENPNGTYSVEVPDDLSWIDVESFGGVVDHLIVPVMLAASYQPGTIKEYIDTDAC